MKKTLLFACAVVAMASCAKNEVVEINQNDPNAIKFSTYVGASTKAGELTTDNLTEFGVYATTETNTYASPYISNSSVAYDTTESAWISNETYYWADNTITFYAYAPFKGTSGTNTIGTTGILPYSDIATSADSQEDIIAAYVDARDRDGNDETTGDTTAGVTSTSVDFTFSHMLSKVAFQVGVKSLNPGDDATTTASTDGLSLTVTEVSLVGVNGAHGGLTLSAAPAMAAPTATAATSYTYGAATTNITAISALADTNGTDGSPAYTTVQSDATSPAAAFMLLPQTLTAWDPDSTSLPTTADTQGAALKMVYTLTQKGSTLVSAQTAYFPLPVATAWAAGTYYVYTLLFDESDLNGGYDEEGEPVLDDTDEINFNLTSVTAWSTASGLDIPNSSSNE